MKCALRMLALDSGILRLPLVGASSRTEEVLNGVLQALGMLGSELDGYIDPRD